ncbi:hypothetical protein HH214_00170 [Mucilaginibacter robiniae]|uniref:Right handed beta helix domain-containing protein n=1 Tax=Mucilaginibacter robiniae TaxID=2728022 RepID=A0A7L5DWF1_9SPHI|nr:right-handed parallel beta-helix repeat-containing protein [Mucilaginibacter robiniae]QJD94397.1 hypothetical protein HH214_00170 [Mucilaginibacter robiniae]
MKKFTQQFLLLNALAIMVVSCKKEATEVTSTQSKIDSKTLTLTTNNITLVNASYVFKATAGSDVTTALQSALNTYKNVSIDANYVISTTLQVPSGGSLTGLNSNSILKAANSRSGLLSSRGIYIDLSGKSSVNIKGITFKPADNMTNMLGWANTVILLSNAHSCIIDSNTFSFSFAYGKGMEAVWITGPSANNTVSNNYIKTLGITYCENGSSNSIIKNNQIINAYANALGGIGNGTTPCYDNQVLNNYIENAGRMGVEDQQNTSGTIIKNNIIKGTSKMPSLPAGQGMGISAVALKTIVDGNAITDVEDYYIEVGGSNGLTITNNLIYDTGAEKGIFVNFLKDVSLTLNKITTIRGNIITNCARAIETFGQNTQQSVSIESNTIIDPTGYGISLYAGSSVQSSYSVVKNTILFNSKTTATRYGIASSCVQACGKQNYTIKLDKNTLTYSLNAPKSTGKDVTFAISVDNAALTYNTINGYSGGVNVGITNNGVTTRGVSFVGNSVQKATWDTSIFSK